MCLNDETATKLMTVIDVIISMKLNQLQNIIGDIMSIANNLSKCSFNQFIELGEYCF